MAGAWSKSQAPKGVSGNFTAPPVGRKRRFYGSDFQMPPEVLDEARFDGEPAVGAWWRKLLCGWWAGRIARSRWFYELTVNAAKPESVALIVWSRNGTTNLARGFGLYRWRKRWSLGVMGMRYVVRWGASSPYTETHGRGGSSEVAMMILRP